MMNWDMPEDGHDQQDNITPRNSIRSIDFFNESQSSVASHGQHNRGAVFGLDLNFETHEFPHLQSYSEYLQPTSDHLQPTSDHLQPTSGDNIGEPVAGVKRRCPDPARNKVSTSRSRAAGTGGTIHGRGVVERRTNTTGDAAAGTAGTSRGRGVVGRCAVSTGNATAGTGGTSRGRGAPVAGGRGGFCLPPTVPRVGCGVRRGGAVGQSSSSHSATTLSDAHVDEDADLYEEDEDNAAGSEKSSSSSANSEDGEDDAVEVARIQTQRMRDCAAFGLLFSMYYEDTFLNKAKYREPDMTGYEWVMRTLKNRTACYNMFRMSRDMFYRLHDLLVSSHGLISTTRMTSIEALAIFLWIVGAPQSVRQADNRFERSLETISRTFDKVLTSVCSLAADIIKPRDPNYEVVHPRLQGSRYSPHFDNCIGAMDGTHIQVTVPAAKVLQYVGRHGYSSQNVLAICDFDMRFTFVVAGWPGSVHDMRVFNDAIRKYEDKFPHPPAGKFYLVDSGYPNKTGYLAPFKGTKYHVPEF